MPTVFSKEINPPPPESNSSSSSSSLSNKNIKQPKIIGKKSVGNQHKFAQQNHFKKLKSNGPEDNFVNSEIYLDARVEQVVDKLSSCCATGTRFGFGCLLSLFRADNNNNSFASRECFQTEYLDCSKRAVQYIKDCRKLGVTDNLQISKRENRDGFLQEVYRECLVDVKDLPDGKTKHVMRYCIPALNQKLGRIHKPEVCLPTLLGVYGFSEYDWRICSQAVKSNPSGRVASLRHKVWKDDKLPEHSYAEMEQVFRENLSITNSGEKNNYYYHRPYHYYYIYCRSENDPSRINPNGRNTESVHSLAATIF